MNRVPVKVSPDKNKIFVRFVSSFPKESTTVHGLWAEGTGGQPDSVNTIECEFVLTGTQRSL